MSIISFQYKPNISATLKHVTKCNIRILLYFQDYRKLKCRKQNLHHNNQHIPIVQCESTVKANTPLVSSLFLLIYSNALQNWSNQFLKKYKSPKSLLRKTYCKCNRLVVERLMKFKRKN